MYTDRQRGRHVDTCENRQTDLDEMQADREARLRNVYCTQESRQTDRKTADRQQADRQRERHRRKTERLTDRPKDLWFTSY